MEQNTNQAATFKMVAVFIFCRVNNVNFHHAIKSPLPLWRVMF